jgi:uncharacterized membrane protein
MAGELKGRPRRSILHRATFSELRKRTTWHHLLAPLHRRILFTIPPAIVAPAISVNVADNILEARWFPVILTTWDALVGVYVLLTALMFWCADDSAPRKASISGGWAARGEFVRILTVAIFVAITSILIFLVLTESEQSSTWTIATAIIAVVASWLAIHSFHAEYYAQKYYKRPENGREEELFLAFPGDEGKRGVHGYLEFSYFALAIGSTFGTTDIEIYSKVVRKAVLLHALISF